MRGTWASLWHRAEAAGVSSQLLREAMLMSVGVDDPGREYSDANVYLEFVSRNPRVTETAIIATAKRLPKSKARDKMRAKARAKVAELRAENKRLKAKLARAKTRAAAPPPKARKRKVPAASVHMPNGEIYYEDEHGEPIDPAELDLRGFDEDEDEDDDKENEDT